MHHYIPRQKENISENQVYFTTLSNHTFDNTGAKSVVVKTSDNGKIRVPTILAILAQRKFSSIILRHRTMPRGINDTCHLYGWMINTLIKNRLAVM
jgi:hypothetical protein